MPIDSFAIMHLMPSRSRSFVRRSLSLTTLALLCLFPYSFASLRAHWIKEVAIKLYTKDKEDRLTRSNRSNGYDYEPEMVQKMLWLRHIYGKVKRFEVKQGHCPLWPQGEVTVDMSVERNRGGKETLIGGSSSFYDVEKVVNQQAVKH